MCRRLVSSQPSRPAPVFTDISELIGVYWLRSSLAVDSLASYPFMLQLQPSRPAPAFQGTLEFIGVYWLHFHCVRSTLVAFMVWQATIAFLSFWVRLGSSRSIFLIFSAWSAIWRLKSCFSRASLTSPSFSTLLMVHPSSVWGRGSQYRDDYILWVVRSSPI